MLTREHIDYLIIDYINGNINQSDKVLLNKWIKESEENQKYFDSLTSIIAKINFSKQEDFEQTNKAFEKINSKINSKLNKRRLLRYISVAASFISIILIAINYNSFYSKQKVKPGFAKVILRTSSGKQFILNKKDTKLIQKNKVIEWTQVSGKLKIKSKSNNTKNKDLTFSEVIVPKSGEYKIELEDGTLVWMNSDSKLKFPESFVGNERKVYLEGEAYFEVAHNKEKPFYVITSKTKVKVLGTSFNVYSYKNEFDTKISLVTGKVNIDLENNESKILTPGKQLTYYGRINSSEIKNVDVNSIIAWKEGKFIFEDMTLYGISLRLDRWFDVRFKFDEDALKFMEFTGIIKKSSKLKDILEAISKTTSVKFKIEKNYVKIYR